MKNKLLLPLLFVCTFLLSSCGYAVYPYEEAAETTLYYTTEETTSALTEASTASETISVPTEATTAETHTSEATSAEAEAEEFQQLYYFRSKKLLESHYEKHGIDMGFATPEEYETAASAVIQSPGALYKTEKEDGDGVYYIEATNEFAVLSTDGYIRTYFLPDAGKKYFDRQ